MKSQFGPRIFLTSIALLALAACSSGPAPGSPAAQTSIEMNGKELRINYSAPSMRGRQIFGPGGLVSNDPTYPVWRAGANDATAFQTGADLDFGGVTVPAGSYTLYALVEDPDHWQLIINKQTGQWGLEYHQEQDVARIPMTMTTPTAPIETYKMTLTSPASATTGPDTGELRMEWENHVATASFRVK